MGELIAVLSGKGGTGKTSLCAGIATALAQQGENVLCIDCDVGLRNLDISLGLTDSGALSFMDVAEGNYPLDRAARHPAYLSLAFLTAPMNSAADEIDPKTFEKMLLQARKEYDYIFLDAPAGVDTGLRLTCTAADRVILVTGAELAAIRDAGRTGQILELMGKDNVRLVVNRIRPKIISAMALTVDDVMDEAGLPLIGIVPEDEDVTIAAAFSTPLLAWNRRSVAAAACRRIANRIRGMHVPLPIK